MAPFWANNDLRRAGSVRYALIDSDDDLLRKVSRFIRFNNKEAEDSDFVGEWMLVVYWDGVHPYPHGSYYNYYLNYYSSFTAQVST